MKKTLPVKRFNIQIEEQFFYTFMNILTAFYKNTKLPIEKLLLSTDSCQVNIIGFTNTST